jgi:hypothetical protein
MLRLVKDRRIGQIRLSRAVVFNRPEIAMKVMEKLLVARAEALFIEDAIEYLGYSKFFEINPPGCKCLNYHCYYNEKTDEVTLEIGPMCGEGIYDLSTWDPKERTCDECLRQKTTCLDQSEGICFAFLKK